MNKNAIQFIESCLNMSIFYKFLYYFLSFRGAALYHFGSAAASAADGGVDIPRGFAQVDMAAADDIFVACFIAAGEGRGEARALFHQQIHELTQGDVVKRGIKDADVAVGEALRRGARRDQLTARFGKALLEPRLLVQNAPYRRGNLTARDA